jgi:hypothetical protein
VVRVFCVSSFKGSWVLSGFQRCVRFWLVKALQQCNRMLTYHKQEMYYSPHSVLERGRVMVFTFPTGKLGDHDFIVRIFER